MCRHVLDTLINLAKGFPAQFLPPSVLAARGGQAETKEEKEECAKTAGKMSDFWEVLIRLDSASANLHGGAGGTSSASSRKGKSATKSGHTAAAAAAAGSGGSASGGEREHMDTSSGSVAGGASETSSAHHPPSQPSHFALILQLLSHPVIKRNSLLTDKLLRLLSHISVALQNSATGGAASPASGTAEGRPITQGIRALIPPYPGAVGSGSVRQTINAHRDHMRSITDAAHAAQAAAENELLGSSSATAGSADGKPADDAATQTEPKIDVGEEELTLAVEVLTSKSCSEEGLEDATVLLMRLSKHCPITRRIIYRQILSGARDLGNTVCGHINSLKEELRDLNLKRTDGSGEAPSAPQPSQPSTSSLPVSVAEHLQQHVQLEGQRGVLHDRFTNESVVITAPSKVKHGAGKEVQLPSMALLTSKSSSQSFFLRILRVIDQIRDLIVKANRAETKQKTSTTEATDQSTSNAAAVDQQQPEESSPSAPSAGGAEGMEVDQPQQLEALVSNAAGSASDESSKTPAEPSLSSELQLNALWDALSECLKELAETPDHHAVLVLQPAVEAFFLVHATEKDPTKSGADSVSARSSENREQELAHVNVDIAPLSPPRIDLDTSGITPSSVQVHHASSASGSQLAHDTSLLPATLGNLSHDTQRFLHFAETHRVVLNQILRQSTTPLADGPFSVLVDHTRVLDFDVKRRYFRQELDRIDDSSRREDLAVHVRRDHVFEDSFRELHRRSSDEWKHRFYIVFENEEGQDAGGLLREWYTIISREIFNPMYALFCTSPGDRVTYMINSSSHCNPNHLQYFKFVGRVIAKAIYDNKLLESYFTRSFYKHILGKLVK